ncbi:MAG: D-tyrosyl-tRNA(Tyr) deacylase [Clostridiales bacterium]|nr:D-tyrosyl-tRNA(Tyr) deacylase [Clostridiales bacterium]
MRFVIQRVQQADVSINGQIVGAIRKGFMVLVGICDTDTKEIADNMLKKMLNLRIFQDENGKTNLALKDVDGQLLIVSQFTLYADCRKGNRPSFIKAGAPEHAKEIYEYILKQCIESGYTVKHGEFGADMKVSLINDGPFTVLLDSDEICR